jgi:hypothetical protein
MPCFLLLIVIIPLRLFVLTNQKRRQPAEEILPFAPALFDVTSAVADGDACDTVIDAVAGTSDYAHLGQMDEFLALRMCSRHFKFSNAVVPSVTAIFRPIWQAGSSSGEDASAIIVPIPFTVPYN